jgi:hypothetical protein
MKNDKESELTNGGVMLALVRAAQYYCLAQVAHNIGRALHRIFDTLIRRTTNFPKNDKERSLPGRVHSSHSTRARARPCHRRRYHRRRRHRRRRRRPRRRHHQILRIRTGTPFNPFLTPKKRGMGRNNGKSFHPYEDVVLLKLIADMGTDWKRVTSSFHHIIGKRRSLASLRHRYNRIKQHREAKVKCSFCNQPKAGHVCYAKLYQGPSTTDLEGANTTVDEDPDEHQSTDVGDKDTAPDKMDEFSNESVDELIEHFGYRDRINLDMFEGELSLAFWEDLRTESQAEVEPSGR